MNGLPKRFYKGGKRKLGRAQLRASDPLLEECLGEEACIDGKAGIPGFYNEERIVARLGGKTSFESIIRTFKFRLCLCPHIICGTKITVCGISGEVAEGGISRGSDGYVTVRLTQCKEC